MLEIRTLGHVGGGNRCRGLLRHALAKGALVYPNQGGRYRAEEYVYGTGVVIAVS
jgi:hypothetical protein